jgi:hypothetical protein
MLSGLHFPNPGEFCVLFFIFYFSVSYNIFSQVSFNPNQAFFILYRTMANSAPMRAMCELLGFTTGAAATLEGNDHGINTLEEVVFLNGKDIDSLLKQLRRPGGVIVGPKIVGGAAQSNPGPLVTNPGHSVSIRAETNLKLAVFYLRHQARISSIVAPASVLLTVVRCLRSTKEYEENVKLLPLPQPPVRARSDPRTNPIAQRATQLRSVIARVYAVSIQNQITTTVP